MRNQTITIVSVAVAAGVLVVALIAGSIIFLTQSDGDESSPDEATGSAEVPEGLEEFYEQDIDWDDCGDNECGEVTVPVDYEDPDGDTIELAVEQKPATSDDSRGPMLINPGGPGASGVEFLPTFSSQASDELVSHYDLTGFDPRGTGESAPLECFDDDTLDEFNASDPSPESKEEINDAKEWTTRLGEACEDNSGELAAHVSTEEAARDMDVLRAVLGARKLDYYGASYGTQLGATYATLFPDNAGRMVLDGAVDPSLDEMGSSMGQNKGFHRALTAYLESCTSQDDCPLGDDVDKAREKLKDFLEGLDDDPMQVKDRELTQGLAMYGVAVTLYNEQSWPSLTQALDGVTEGDGDMLLRLSDAYFERNPDGTYASNMTEANIAISCLDGQEDVSADDVKSALPKFEKKSPVFGDFMAWGMMSCSQWPIDVTHPQPDIDASDADPILVVGTTRDPATPYEWSEALRDQLGSGVLLTREGDGHTGYAQGNSCTDDTIDGYLVKGDVPDDGKKCSE